MAIVFELRARKARKEQDEDTNGPTLDGDAVAGDSEETPLLRTED